MNQWRTIRDNPAVPKRDDGYANILQKRTTGFKPLRAGRIHFRCPGCGRKMSNILRAEDGSDPEKAMLAEFCCDRCCRGHKDCGPQFFDANGNQVFCEVDE